MQRRTGRKPSTAEGNLSMFCTSNITPLSGDVALWRTQDDRRRAITLFASLDYGSFIDYSHKCRWSIMKLVYSVICLPASHWFSLLTSSLLSTRTEEEPSDVPSLDICTFIAVKTQVGPISRNCSGDKVTASGMVVFTYLASRAITVLMSLPRFLFWLYGQAQDERFQFILSFFGLSAKGSWKAVACLLSTFCCIYCKQKK